jgi:ADP-heptose:LPS heptosyltransferase
MARSSEWMRMLDRAIGAVASRLLVRTHPRPLPERPTRIGIIQPTAIGDTVLCTGLLQAIHDRYPEAQLVLFHGRNNAAILKALATPVMAVLCDFAKPLGAWRTVDAAKVDLLFDLSSWPNATAICARLTSAITVGFASRFNPGRGRLFDVVVAHRADRHEIENLAAMARLLGAGPYRMHLAPQPCKLVAELDMARTVLCHVSAGGTRAQDKAWPAAFWAELCTRLVAAGYTPTFTGDAGDQDAVARVVAMMGDAGAATLSLCGKVPLAELADLLVRVRLLVSIDTGVLHIASAVNAPVLGLHGPTRSWRWGARSPNARSLDSTHPSAGYVSYGFESADDGPEVMKCLTPDIVAAQAFAMLEANRVDDEVATL